MFKLVSWVPSAVRGSADVMPMVMSLIFIVAGLLTV